jgi:putative membrane protein
MKKKLLSFAICLLALAVWSCNNSSDSSTAGNDSSSAVNNDSLNNVNNTMNNTPLSKDDSMFVMEAAMGGMMEVEAGKVAQQNASNQRVKDFGSMMVTDHSAANDQLMGLASSHGMTLPSALPANMQKELDAMKAMKGAAFDKHYVSMMVDDHKTDIGKFQTEADKGTDGQLKTWASNTLPTLQKHMDSIQAIKKGM